MTDEREYPAVWPWPGTAKPPGYDVPKPNYTGCECHDACNEAWFRAHMNDVKEDKRGTKARR